jgi:hypothetical protein
MYALYILHLSCQDLMFFTRTQREDGNPTRYPEELDLEEQAHYGN